MNIEELRVFLLEANKNGYGNESTKILKNSDNSETIIYERGDWRFHDSWVGGVKFGGRDIVSLKNVPIWIMTYYGYPLDSDVNVGELYGFLKRALMKMPEDRPFRGPGLLVEGDWRYSNKTEGSVERFDGMEQIHFKDGLVYEARFMGGVVGD
ncbi:MAG: hypothetical protein HZB70_00400 [Candidatus Berkelbacteria bacterium]|nr:MAG: hypothetical protein HZB70_00400 [Candidatus Berkelbacteria bacterium]QQG51433.1 MAG: hypothetical protein HY845_02600 [Candidatus Berkelbacteria bacterium]